MKLRDKLLSEGTAYQRIAHELNVSAGLVGRIARGERKGLRGKGLLIKQRIEALVDEKEG